MSTPKDSAVSRRDMLAGLAGGAIFVAAGATNEVQAAGVDRIRYQIKNSTNSDLYVKIVGHTNDWMSVYQEDAYFPKGKDYHDDLFKGERIVGIWDKSGKLIGCGKVHVRPMTNTGLIDINTYNLPNNLHVY